MKIQTLIQLRTSGTWVPLSGGGHNDNGGVGGCQGVRGGCVVLRVRQQV